MSNRGAILRLTLACSVCVALLLFGVAGLLFRPVSATAVSELPLTAADESDRAVPPAAEAPEASGTASENQPTAAALPTAGEATVVGRVLERFFSPYTANTSYNGIYLKNSTSHTVDLKALLASPLPYKIEANGKPQVLILHTHATESFLSEDKDTYTKADLSRTTDNTKNMVHLGDLVAKRLNEAGFVTVHDKTQHDYPSYNGSYTRSAQTVKNCLKQNPSIKIVLDLHRDAITSGDTDKIKPIIEIGGKKAAQIMLVMGSQGGSVTNFPQWQENLKLAVRLQQTVESLYPSLARSVQFMERCYNENLTTGSLLIEIGTDGNSLSEAEYSAELLGNALVSLLKGLS